MPGTWTLCSMNSGKAVDGEGRDEVQHRHRQVDLDAARGFFLRLHREHRQLGDADTAKATDEFLMMFIDSLVSGGMTMRNAIGSST